MKLKTAKDFTVPKHLRTNAEKKTVQLVQLQQQVRSRGLTRYSGALNSDPACSPPPPTVFQIYQKRSDMNARVLALRDSKSALVGQFHSRLRDLRTLQERLPPEQWRPVPAAPTLTRDETPDTKLRYDSITLQRYAAPGWHDEAPELPIVVQREGEDERRGTHTPDALSELEQEMQETETIRQLHLQDALIKQVVTDVSIHFTITPAPPAVVH